MYTRETIAFFYLLLLCWAMLIYLPGLQSSKGIQKRLARERVKRRKKMKKEGRRMTLEDLRGEYEYEKKQRLGIKW